MSDLVVFLISKARALLLARRSLETLPNLTLPTFAKQRLYSLEASLFLIDSNSVLFKNLKLIPE